MSQNPAEGPKSPELRPAIDPPEAAPTSSSSYRARPSGAQFYSPPPSAEKSPQQTAGASGTGRWRLAAVATVVAVGVVAGAWYGLSGGGLVTPPPAAAAGDQLKTFTVSAADVDEKATQALKALLAGGAASAAAATGGQDDLRAANAPALKAMAENNPKMAEEITSGKRVLYRVYLLDFLADDADHAELSVNGASQGNVKLKNAGTSFLIPLAPGLPAQMKLGATADGGGGVTVGFVSSLGEARTRIMQLGEFETWQVMVQ